MDRMPKLNRAYYSRERCPGITGLVLVLAAMIISGCWGQTSSSDVTTLVSPTATTGSASPESIVISPNNGTERINAVALYKETILAVGTDTEVFLYDIANSIPTLLWSEHTDSQILGLAFSVDGTELASGSYAGKIVLWDVEAGKQLAQLNEHTGPVSRVAFAPQGKYLASGSFDGTVIIWDLASQTPERIYQDHTGIVNDIDWSPDGKLLVSGSLDNTAIIWELSSDYPIRTLIGPTTGTDAGIESVAWSPTDDLIATGGDDGKITLWGTTTGASQETVAVPQGRVNRLAWSPNGGKLASASYGPVQILNVTPSQPPQILTGHKDWVTSIVWPSDGELLVTGSWDGQVIIWQVAQ